MAKNNRAQQQRAPSPPAATAEDIKAEQASAPPDLLAPASDEMSDIEKARAELKAEQAKLAEEKALLAKQTAEAKERSKVAESERDKAIEAAQRAEKERGEMIKSIPKTAEEIQQDKIRRQQLISANINTAQSIKDKMMATGFSSCHPPVNGAFYAKLLMKDGRPVLDNGKPVYAYADQNGDVMADDVLENEDQSPSLGRKPKRED